MNKGILANNKIVFVVAIIGLLYPLLSKVGIIGPTDVNLIGRHLCFAIAAMGVNLIWGYTGILSLCQAFFFCLGGYAIGMHMLLKTGTKGVYGSALPDFMVWNGVEKLPFFWKPFYSLPLTLAMAIIIPGIIAGLFGFFAFRSRIKGVYFAIITQAFALAMWLLFLRNETMLGGTNGLTDFKTLFGMDLAQDSSRTTLYYITLGVVFLCFFLNRFLINSKLGRLLIATRDSEHRLRFIGYSITNLKIFVFVIAGVLAAVGGLLYVPQTGIITPGRMTVQASIEIVIWCALGGRATLWGPVVGALVVNILRSILTGAIPEWWPYVLGGLFVSVVIFFPDGIIGLLQKVKFFKRKTS